MLIVAKIDLLSDNCWLFPYGYVHLVSAAVRLIHLLCFISAKTHPPVLFIQLSLRVFWLCNSLIQSTFGTKRNIKNEKWGKKKKRIKKSTVRNYLNYTTTLPSLMHFAEQFPQHCFPFLNKNLCSTKVSTKSLLLA